MVAPSESASQEKITGSLGRPSRGSLQKAATGTACSSSCSFRSGTSRPRNQDSVHGSTVWWPIVADLGLQFFRGELFTVIIIRPHCP